MSEPRTYTDAEIEAALSGELPEDTPETPEAEAVVEEAPAPVEEAVEADVEPPAEPVADDTEEDPEPEDDWSLKARKIQAAKDREVAAANAEIMRLKEELARKQGREEALAEQQSSTNAAEIGSVTTEDLRYGITNDLPRTFQWTVQNRPDMVPALISMVRDTEGMGHGIADQMVVEYSDYKHQLAIQAQEERFGSIEAAREAEQAPLRSQQAMESVVENLTERFGENFTAVQDQIAERLQTQGREYIDYLREEAAKHGQDPDAVVTPELMREMMVDIYIELREGALNAAAAAPAQPTATPAAAGALGTTASGPAQTDDDQDFLASFIAGARGADIDVDPNFLP